LFGFLTTEANAVVAPIHAKAMPVILTQPAEVDRWLEADTSDALALQRPLPDDALRIVAKGEKEDPVTVRCSQKAASFTEDELRVRGDERLESAQKLPLPAHQLRGNSARRRSGVHGGRSALAEPVRQHLSPRGGRRARPRNPADICYSYCVEIGATAPRCRLPSCRKSSG
jgi:hypothetical protein